MNWELIGISLYVLSMLFTGQVVSKKIKNDDDYFLAGRSLGPFLATFSIFATWFGAETCIGTAGAVYKNGLSRIHADPLGYSICLLVMGLFFAKILWSKKITTIPDLFRERFSPTTEKITALIMIPSSIIWASAQIRAFGQILHSTTEMGLTTAISLATLVVIIYTVFGGLLADAYTDLIQGIALILGLFFLLAAIVIDLGGISATLGHIDSSKLTLFRFENQEGSFLGRLELWMVPILGSLMSQELVSRVVASKSSEVAYFSSLRASGLYLLIGLIPVLIGLTLLASSALLSHNLIFPMFDNLTDRKKVFLARAGVLMSGIIAFILAFVSESITELVEMASSLGGPSILVLTMIALYVKWGNAMNAIFSIVLSLVFWILGHFYFEIDYPVILTVLVCGLSYFLSLPIFSFIRIERVFSVIRPVKSGPQNLDP